MKTVALIAATIGSLTAGDGTHSTNAGSERYKIAGLETNPQAQATANPSDRVAAIDVNDSSEIAVARIARFEAVSADNNVAYRHPLR